MHFVTALLSLTLLALGISGLYTNDPDTRYITYEEASPILVALQEILPAELRTASSSEIPGIWQKWVERRDAEIRDRLARGDEDSVVNLMLFGTSFTTKPRVTIKTLSQAVASSAQPSAASVAKTIQDRAVDLVRAMASPVRNERLAFARRVVERNGYNLQAHRADERVIQYLLSVLDRVLKENAGYARVLESARLLGDPSAEFAERSRLFEGRGLSSDTSLLPNFALEKALTSIKALGLLKLGSVHRVAVIGPGLDFTDKEDGYDFYPQQTIQPFAIVDTLLRLGLSTARDISVTTLDLSPRVNDHLAAARRRADSGVGYIVQLPRSLQSSWRPQIIDYWSKLGDRIGVPVAPAAIPAAVADVKVRAVRIRPSIVSKVRPKDVNIVLQRLELPAQRNFDLIVSTNILVYYNVFEQSLALCNIAQMLRPGGLLLSNNSVLELPSSRIRSVGYETVAYSDKDDDGDHIVWYQRSLEQ